MLNKKELKKIPLCPIPKIGKKELKDTKFVTAVKVVENPKCGQIFVADNYSIDDNKLQVRFFSDRKNSIVYKVKSDQWVDKYLTPMFTDKNNSYRSCVSAAVNEDIETAKRFFDNQSEYFYMSKTGWQYYTTHGIIAVIDGAIQKRKAEKRQEANDRAEGLFEERRHWFPKYNDKVKKFCNNVAFKETYIFFSNKGSDHTRECTCTRCGKSWITTENVKHKSETACPKCKSKALWWAVRYEHCIRNITTIVTPYKKANRLILRWAVVTRRFSGQKSLIAFEDDAYTFYLNENGKQKIVSYFKTNSYYSSGEFTKAFINQTCHHDAYVYTGDLKRTFGYKYYNVNFSEVLKAQNSPMNFIGLLDNLKNYPQTEYLCKMGLASLASYFTQTDFLNDGCRIKRQYLDMYRNMGVNVPEHRVINSTDRFVHENDLKEIRRLHKAGMTYECLQQAVQYQRPDILHDYILRQKAVTGAPISHINYWLRDYYNMCDSLDVPIMGQTARPKNLKKAHDIILKRYNEVKNQIDAEKSKAALEIVNQWFKGYKKDGMCIQVPHERADFIREGQALSHCVGNERYYKNHIAGTQMIFFIRKAASPDKPFVTCEIDMRTGMVLQCYGFGDSVPPKEVKRFAKDFARFIQSRISVVRKAG